MVQFLVYASFSFIVVVHNFLNCTGSIRSDVREDYCSEKSSKGSGNSHCNDKIRGSKFCC